MNLSRNIRWHTRLFSDNTVKIQGGSFGGDLSVDTANRLVNVFFTVTVKPSGTPVFVDREGREVRLYMSVDVADTKKGKEAITADSLRRAEIRRKELEEYSNNQEAIEDAMCGLTAEEVLEALANAKRGKT